MKPRIYSKPAPERRLPPGITEENEALCVAMAAMERALRVFAVEVDDKLGLRTPADCAAVRFEVVPLQLHDTQGPGYGLEVLRVGHPGRVRLHAESDTREGAEEWARVLGVIWLMQGEKGAADGTP